MMVTNIFGEQSLRWHSFSATMWSSRSRLQLPTHRSAMSFCHGLWNDVCVGIYPGGFQRCDHLEPKLLIAIKDQVFCERLQNGNASRNCWMIQLLVACLVPQSAGVLANHSRMRKRACTDLCGWRSAMVVPIAIVNFGALAFVHNNKNYFYLLKRANLLRPRFAAA